MDPRLNPYSPGAGTRPPALTGRDAEIEQFDVMLSRLSAGRSARSMIVSGLRGVGKTVLLNTFEAMARRHGWHTAEREVTTATSLPVEIARMADRALRTLTISHSARTRVTELLGALSSFTLSVADGTELTFDPRALRRLSAAELGEDFADIFTAIGEAAQAKQRGVLILLDEAQFLERQALEALLAGVHRVAQRELPFAVVGAGLPQLPRLAGEAKSYAERLFTFPTIGRLPMAAAADALEIPAKDHGVRFDDTALERILALTDRYPYFIQEYGSATWDLAEGPVIRLHDVEAAELHVTAALDEGFFRVRFERATAHERRYMRALAELGDGPQRSGEVARLLEKPATSLSPQRDALIKKGLVYAPEHGVLDFTVPHFAGFMRRSMPFGRRRPESSRLGG
jgi:hypothetical protein